MVGSITGTGSDRAWQYIHLMNSFEFKVKDDVSPHLQSHRERKTGLTNQPTISQSSTSSIIPWRKSRTWQDRRGRLNTSLIPLLINIKQRFGSCLSGILHQNRPKQRSNRVTKNLFCCGQIRKNK